MNSGRLNNDRHIQTNLEFVKSKTMAFEDNDNGFQLYLREIGEYPLITVE